MPVTVVQAHLGAPGELDHLKRNIPLALLEQVAHTWRVARVVRSLAQHVTEQAVAALGDRTAMLLAAAGGFGGYGTSVGHQLRCGSEPTQAANFGNDGHRAQEPNASERLERANV